MTEHNDTLTTAGIDDEPVVPDPDEFESQDDLTEVATDDENVPDPTEAEGS